MSTRKKSNFTGVYTRKSEVRRHDGKPDVCFDICYKTPEGKLIWEKVGWRSEGYSVNKASEIRADRIRALRHPEHEAAAPQVITMAQAWEVFKKQALVNVRGRGEISRYETHIEPRFGNTNLYDITTLALEDFKNELFAKKTVRGDTTLSPETVRHILSDIRRIYRKMAEWGMYSGKIPTERLRMPKVDNKRERFLTPREADMLLCALENRSCTWWRIALISLYTGLRLSEITSLRGQNIDFEAGLIMVDGKTGRRAAYISAPIVPALKSVIPANPSALLFSKRNGKQMDSGDTSNTFARAVDDMGLNDGITDRRRKVVFHTLRHTFASWLAQKGVPLYTIGELIGHTTVQMTKRYAKLSPDNKRSAVEIIAKVHANSHES